MSALDRLLERPLAYHLWQRAAMAEAKLAPVLDATDLTRVRRVLDVGCGPGTNAARFAETDYVGVDLNPRYVEAARRRHPGLRFQVADAAALSLPGETFDFILVNSLLHHLDDPAVDRALEGLRALLAPGGRVHVLDLVLPERRGLARRLARWDRGEHPRPFERWREILGRWFEPIVFEPYTLGPGVALWHMVYFQGKIESP